jgi:hypothetical protein
VNHELESCQPGADGAGWWRRPGGDRVGSRGLRNQPEAVAVDLDHHDDYDGNYYRDNPAADADRERDQSHGRQLILATSDSAVGADGTTWHSPSPRRVATRTGTFIMSSNRVRLIGLAGGGALVVMGAVTAGCGTSANQAPSTTTTTTTTTTTSSPSSTPAPTEKSVSPTGGNLFTPGVKAPPAPAVSPGQHPGINGIP